MSGDGVTVTNETFETNHSRNSRDNEEHADIKRVWKIQPSCFRQYLRNDASSAVGTMSRLKVASHLPRVAYGDGGALWNAVRRYWGFGGEGHLPRRHSAKHHLRCRTKFWDGGMMRGSIKKNILKQPQLQLHPEDKIYHVYSYFLLRN